jgi:hypothetical protein
VTTARDARLAEERRLLDGYDVYDRAVDVVSVFEWLHTDPGVHDVPGTVAHFERFPALTAPDGKPATPDFTIAFTQGPAIVGEIARFSLRPESIDGLCSQIGRYDTLLGVPGGSGKTVAAEIDVVLLVELHLGMPALQRILKERYEDPDHPYKPSRPPVIVQYARSGGKYTFQRLPDPSNGTVRDTGRTKSVGAYVTKDSLGVSAAQFAHVKSAKAFVNDQMDPLYLATHLWSKTLPTLVGRPTEEAFTVTEAELAEVLRKHHRHGRAKDVRHALALLDRAGLAAQGETKGEWKIAWRQLNTSKGRDLHQTIAARAAGTSKAARAIPARRPPEPPVEQMTLEL